MVESDGGRAGGEDSAVLQDGTDDEEEEEEEEGEAEDEEEEDEEEGSEEGLQLEAGAAAGRRGTAGGDALEVRIWESGFSAYPASSSSKRLMGSAHLGTSVTESCCVVACHMT